jgi:hypothetical protein
MKISCMCAFKVHDNSIHFLRTLVYLFLCTEPRIIVIFIIITSKIYLTVFKLIALK